MQCSVMHEQDHYELTLIGNATIIAYCELQLIQDSMHFLDFEYTGETIQYEKCLNYVTEKIGFFLSE